MSKHTWQDNAAEFATLDRGEGWPFARLVACSVEKQENGGRREPGVSFQSKTGKVAAKTFADSAGTSAKRVLNYLRAWDLAASAGHCVPAGSLVPEDSPTTMEPDVKVWKKYYSSGTGLDAGENDSPSKMRAEAIKDQAVRDGSGPSKAVDIASNPKALRTAIKADPATARAAREALEEASQERADEAVRRAGGDPMVHPFPGELKMAAIAIRNRWGYTRSDINNLRRRCEADQWEKDVLPELEEGLAMLTQVVFGKMPDSVEDIIGGEQR